MFEITLNNLKSAIKHAKNCDILIIYLKQNLSH